ncbi:kelch-like protein 2 isoform X2 [Daktulosphaira vitifoliae]|uniref:kelch-like protein 2 isoform X2 n=1 Tax=Daktulosphaira vitifoliae TaxID=58002 RepID=UPI0021AA4E10|nr:kelch-like protein 2 isoform X2 [Daktulosphaira vitifoliae]
MFRSTLVLPKSNPRDKNNGNVALIRDGQYIWCDKNILAIRSIYLEHIFTNNPTQREFVVDNLFSSAQTLENLIDFMYTSSIEFTESNMIEILLDSKTLGLKEVEDAVLNYIKSRITIYNCLQLCNFKNMIDVLKDDCVLFIKKNINYVIRTQDFFKLDSSQIIDFIENVQNESNQKKIFEALMMWVKYDQTNRKQFLPKLFIKINIEAFPISYIENVIMKDVLIMENVQCSNHMASIFLKMLQNAQIMIQKLNRKRSQLSQILMLAQCMISETPAIKVLQEVKETEGVIKSWENNQLATISNNKSQCIENTEMSENENDIHLIQTFLFTKKENFNSQVIIICQFSEDFNEQSLSFLDRSDKKWKNINLNGFQPSTSMCTFFEDGKYFEIGKSPVDNKLVNMIARSSKKLSESNYLHLTPKLIHLKHSVYILETSLNGKSQYNEIYDIQSNRYRKIEKMNEFRTDFSVVACDNLIYAVGGYNSKTIECYYPEENVWRIFKHTMKVPRKNAAVCVVNDTIYVFGGTDKANNVLFSGEKFDVRCQIWHDIPPMNKGRTNALAVSKNGFIFVIGGENQNSYEVFDTSSMTWKLSSIKMNKTWAHTKGVTLDAETSFYFKKNMKYFI